MSFYLSALMLGLALSALGFGIYISMRIFNIPDITTDGSYTTGAVVTAILLTQGFPVPLAFLCSLVAGMIAGGLTGFIHTKLKINPLLSGILIMTALYSINLTLMGRSNIPLINTHTIFDIFRGDNPFVGQLIILGVISSCLLFLLIFLLKTDFGISMRATGNNETMARANGVNTSKMKIYGLAVSNGLTAISGFLMCQFQGFADINMGVGIVIMGLGAVIIGETLSSIKTYSALGLHLSGVLGGSVLFRLILAIALSLGLDPSLLKLVTSLIVLAIVSLPALKKKVL